MKEKAKLNLILKRENYKYVFFSICFYSFIYFFAAIVFRHKQ